MIVELSYCEPSLRQDFNHRSFWRAERVAAGLKYIYHHKYWLPLIAYVLSLLVRWVWRKIESILEEFHSEVIAFNWILKLKVFLCFFELSITKYENSQMCCSLKENRCAALCMVFKGFLNFIQHVKLNKCEIKGWSRILESTVTTVYML